MRPDVAAAVAQLKAKRNGSGWIARCPAHDDQRESLSIGEGDAGRLLLRCFAGCEFETILARLDLPRQSTPTGGRREVARYDYSDETGAVLYQVVRFEPKDFRPVQPNGTWSLRGARRVLYGLPALLRACKAGKVVTVVEGEKDADALAAVGVCATTITGGAQGTLPDGFAGYFAGASRVAVLPDNDEPGRGFAERIAATLHAAGVSVVVVTLPGVPDKGDVSDWLASGGTPAQLAKLIEATAPWSPPTEAPRAAGAPPGDERAAVTVRTVRLADVEAEEVRWLWGGYVPLGKLTVLEGDPGLSKSTLTLWLAAQLSSGGRFPDGTVHPIADALFLTYEDGVADTLRPRAEAAGANLQRVHVLQGISTNGDPDRLLSIPGDLSAVRAEVVRTGARLLVIDPLDAALSGSTDTYKSHDIRLALAPLAQLAEELAIAMVVVRHLTKARGGSAITAGSGSIGITGAARSVLAVHRHPDDEEDSNRRVLAVVKCNLARLAPSRVFHLVPDGDVARIEWGDEVTISADDLTSARGDDREERADAKAFLENALSRSPGGRPKAELLKDAAKEGIGGRTLERAFKHLGGHMVREFQGPAVWRLDSVSPSYFATNPQPRHELYIGEAGEVGEVGEVGAPETASGTTNGAAEPDAVEVLV
jgi:hypothetical protein